MVLLLSSLSKSQHLFFHFDDFCLLHDEQFRVNLADKDKQRKKAVILFSDTEYTRICSESRDDSILLVDEQKRGMRKNQFLFCFSDFDLN